MGGGGGGGGLEVAHYDQICPSCLGQLQYESNSACDKGARDTRWPISASSTIVPSCFGQLTRKQQMSTNVTQDTLTHFAGPAIVPNPSTQKSNSFCAHWPIATTLTTVKLASSNQKATSVYICGARHTLHKLTCLC